MGSLMSGWDSPVKDPKSVKLIRNKSLTKEKIEDYWRLKKKTEEEHLKAISPEAQEMLAEESASNELKRTTSLPMIGRKNGNEVRLGKESDAGLEQLGNCCTIQNTTPFDQISGKCRWTRSNWAFLNEPPVIAGEVPKNKYAAQYHIATIASTNPDTRISSM